MADLLFYGTEDDFGEYCEANGHTTPTGADVEPSLLRASRFIDARYGERFTGVKSGGRDQVRAWPRNGAYNREGWGYLVDDIPFEVTHATYEAALREFASPGSLQPDVTPGQIIESASVQGAVSVTYAKGGTDTKGQLPVLTVLDGIMASLLCATESPFAGRRTRG